MAVYSVEGKLGTGKTKFTVWMAQNALNAGRRVASNVDMQTHLLQPFKRTTYTRIPDKPTDFDFLAMGHGNPDTYNEDNNGLLILDELGTWLNSRSFQDKGRAGVIDWLIHARKYGWDVYLIVQDANMIDKQVRESLIEYQCRCMQLGKIRIPVIGKILSMFSERLGYLPKGHTVTARTGYGANAIVADRWIFRGYDLHAAYDTRQIFTANYDKGVHSVLPPWDWSPKEPPGKWLRDVKGYFKSHQAIPLVSKPKKSLIQLIQKLPPDRRVSFINRHSAAIYHADSVT